MLLESISLKNFLSYGDEGENVPLTSLNVIIGPNGSGKSNLMEAIELIRGAPKDLLTPIRDGGGVHDWLWKGSDSYPKASIDVVVKNPNGKLGLRYVLSFTAVSQRFEIVDERIENESPLPRHKEPYFFYHFNNGRGVLNVKGKKRQLKHEEIDPSASILSQLRLLYTNKRGRIWVT